MPSIIHHVEHVTFRCDWSDVFLMEVKLWKSQPHYCLITGWKDPIADVKDCIDLIWFQRNFHCAAFICDQTEKPFQNSKKIK